MALRGSRLLGSLAMVLAFALLTWVMIGDRANPTLIGFGSEYLGQVIVVLFFPGMLAGFLVSGNIHIASTWICELGNFIFYSGVVYLVLAHREKRKAQRRTVEGRGA